MRFFTILALLAVTTFLIFGSETLFPEYAPRHDRSPSGILQSSPASSATAVKLAPWRVPLCTDAAPDAAASTDTATDTGSIEVSGVLVDEHFRPIPDISVQLYHPWVSALRDQRNHWVFAQTDEDGRFSAMMPAPRFDGDWITYELRDSRPAYLGMGRHRLGLPMVLTALSAGHPDRRIEGHLRFLDRWPNPGIVYLLSPSDPLNPIASQRIDAKTCELKLEGIMSPIRQTPGPVWLAVDGEHGAPCISLEFDSVRSLARALENGLDVLVRQTSVRLPSYRSATRYREASILRCDHPAFGGRVASADVDATGTSCEASLGDGRYRLVATPVESDSKVFGTFEVVNGVASPAIWTHALPGDVAIDLALLDPEGNPLQGRNVTYTMLTEQGVDLDVSGSKRSDEHGKIRLEGLLEGNYQLWVDFGQRPGENYRRKILEMRAPGQLTVTAERSAAVYVVPAVDGHATHGEFEVAMRREGSADWRTFTMTPAGPEAVVHLAPGLWEAVVHLPGLAAGVATVLVTPDDALPGVLASRLEVRCEKLVEVTASLDAGAPGPVVYGAEFGFRGYRFEPGPDRRVELLVPSDWPTRLSCSAGPLELRGEDNRLVLARGL